MALAFLAQVGFKTE